MINFTMRFILIFTTALILSGCYQSESSLKDNLIYCPESKALSFNPQISHDISSLDATTHQLYNRLVKRDPTTQNYIPDLATGWLLSEDKLSYTFFLRENVNFHQTEYFTPTRHFKADDVIFSLQRMLDQDHSFHSVNRGMDYYFFNHPFTHLIRNIVKIDDYTIKFILKKPDITLLDSLAAHYSVILSQEYSEQLIARGTPEKIDFYPIGTGPYKFKSTNDAGITHYINHAKFWGGKVSVNNLIFDVTENNTKRYAKLLTGECDIIANPAPSQLKQMSEKPNILLSSEPTANILLWAFNSNKIPFTEKKIRQAFSQAVDQKNLLEAVFYQSATATNTLLNHQSWAYNRRSTDIQYKPQEALRTLQEMGYDFNSTITLLTPVKNSLFNHSFHKIAELIQANLLKIGVKSDILFLTQTELEKRLISGKYDTYLTSVNGKINDPDSIFRPLLSCDSTVLEGNSSQWCSKEVQSLLNLTLLESNFTTRIKNYYKLQEIIQEERIYFPIAHALRMDAFKTNISGFLVDPFTGINFQNIKKTEAH
ncbi:ABC dipeptide transporter extracellular solute-binding protein, family 5 [Psychromonas ingrahamii 37]|uniref:ABC dipeptide transporter extracellular solute-binding protein, family 5 n=2 Tax=Psychromonas ingrahamii TaxID=357794 RepID=A1SWR8_PSYIN|nr:ABC dipeptide transporter extracellular solute-binding protein, family 5 [Psychromonas ingrahamii 37]